MTYKKPSSDELAEMQNAAHRLRIDSIESTTVAGSGHPTSCASAAELMSVLFKRQMRYHVQDPGNAANDRFVLSKGHAAPVLYAAWKEVGFLKEDLNNLRKFTSDLEGHPPTTLPFVDVATGSLGQGLSNAAGMAWVGKQLDKDVPYRVYCMMGDGECAEGSVWEAMQYSSHYKLDNLCAIIDCNRLGQSEATALGHEMDVYRKRGEAFGWNTIVIDGHDVAAIAKAFSEAEAATESVYANDHGFAIGKANFVKKGDSVAVFGCGITLHNALEAEKILAKDGINISVVDPFTVKPMDADAVKKAVELSGGKLLTVEDHYAYGGLHSAVSEVVCMHGLGAKVTPLAVPGVARSGKSAELMAWAGIDAAGIVAAVKKMI